jgi:hypothetical protein
MYSLVRVRADEWWVKKEKRWQPVSAQKLPGAVEPGYTTGSKRQLRL